jgi:hypothetical protein
MSELAVRPRRVYSGGRYGLLFTIWATSCHWLGDTAGHPAGRQFRGTAIRKRRKSNLTRQSQNERPTHIRAFASYNREEYKQGKPSCRDMEHANHLWAVSSFQFRKICTSSLPPTQKG